MDATCAAAVTDLQTTKLAWDLVEWDFDSHSKDFSRRSKRSERNVRN